MKRVSPLTIVMIEESLDFNERNLPLNDAMLGAARQTSLRETATDVCSSVDDSDVIARNDDRRLLEC